MGYNTQVLIINDALGDIERNEKFIRDEMIRRADKARSQSVAVLKMLRGMES